MSNLQLFTRPYGREAALLLRERISATKANDPLAPVTVVVPTNYVGVSTRRLLASGELGPITTRGNGIAGLTLLTVYRLAELLGAPRLAAAGRRPVSTPVIAAAVRGVLADGAGVFAPVREHPSTEEALVRAHRELSELRPGSLDTLAQQSRRACDVVRIHRTVRDRLADDWFEEADLMAAACDALADGSSVVADLGTMFLYLPQDLSLPAADLVRAVAQVAPVEVIAARTGAQDADADVDRSLRRLGLDPPAAPHVQPPIATRIVSVSDAEEEARSAVEAVITAARVHGTALERMAICYPAPEPYARIVAEQLTAAQIRFNGRAVRPLADRLLGRWLLDLLRLPDERYARPAITSLLAEAPVRTGDGRPVPSSAWERISRDAGVVHDRGEWMDKLRRFADGRRAQADREEGSEDRREWLVERLRRDAARADALRGFLAGLFGDLDRAQRLSRWSQLVAWCHAAITRYLGGEPARDRWPEVERDAAERVEASLDRLAGLDAVEPAIDLRIFRRTLQLELDDDLGRVGEFGNGVLVGTPSSVLGVDLDLVVVLGLAEGVFPTRPREDSLLTDAERASVADELRPRADHVGVEHRHLLAALASSRGQRVLTFPRGDLRRSIERAPSRWLLDSVEALRDDHADEPPRTLPRSARWYEQVASFAGRVHSVEFPATRQEYGLRALADGARTPLDERGGAPLVDHPLVAGDRALRRGTELVTARRSDRFTRFDGNLGHLHGELPSPVDRVVSASQLETWLRCPHSYLMQYVLKVQPVENPEELLEIDALEKGSLVHDVLERWLCELIEHDLPGPAEPWPADARARLREIAEAACEDAQARGVTGHPLLWRRDRRRIMVDLDLFLRHDDARRLALSATPVAAERPFGMPRELGPPVEIDLGDGRTVSVRGRIDRIDRTGDGTLVVVDYKTGSTRNYTDLNDAQPLGDGTKLQLPIYGLAVQGADDDATAIRTEYWFVSTKGNFEQIGYDLTDEVIDRLCETLRVAVDGIESGLFPMRPPEPGWSLFTECRYCDPDELGTSDRYRDWERIRHAPELRDYVSLVDAVVIEEQP